MTTARFEQLNQLSGWTWGEGHDSGGVSRLDPDGEPPPHGHRWSRLAEAVAFWEHHGRWPGASDRSDPRIARLASWVNAQRYRGRAFLAGDVTAMPVKWFDHLDQTPGWTWGSRRQRNEAGTRSTQQRWELRLAEAVAFRDQHGHWPKKVRKQPNQPLANWVSEQRKLGRRYLDGDVSAMPAERFERLDATPGWEWQVAARRDFSNSVEGREAQWQRRFSEAVAFYEQHGRWPSRSDNSGLDRPIAEWVATQRRQGRRYLRGQQSLMTTARFEQLNELPAWTWSMQGTD